MDDLLFSGAFTELIEKTSQQTKKDLFGDEIIAGADEYFADVWNLYHHGILPTR